MRSVKPGAGTRDAPADAGCGEFANIMHFYWHGTPCPACPGSAPTDYPQWTTTPSSVCMDGSSVCQTGPFSFDHICSGGPLSLEWRASSALNTAPIFSPPVDVSLFRDYGCNCDYQ